MKNTARMPDDDKEGKTEKASERFLNRITTLILPLAEDVIYFLVAVVLAAAALVVLGDAGYELVTGFEDGVKKAIESTLDALLLTFILVELLSAVRTTVTSRHLVAEPFLLVGIIAAIKEIVVVASFDTAKKDFDKAMVEIGVLGGMVVGLALASFLVRLKQREPGE